MVEGDSDASPSIFPTNEQLAYAKDIARLKHAKETKLLIDTREKFTKRYQFEKLSHNVLTNTPTDTQLSCSVQNDLPRYDSKTIFR